MSKPCPVPGYRWAKSDETLIPGTVSWYDEDPEGTDFPVGFDPPTVGGLVDGLPWDWLEATHQKCQDDWPSNAHGLCGIIVRQVAVQGATPAPKASPFHIAAADIPEVTRIKVRPDDVKALISEVFPGARLLQRNRIGGLIYSFEVWRFGVEVSISLASMTEKDASGDATFTFIERPDKGKPTLINQFTTGHFPDLEAGLRKARAYVLGIVFAIDQVCNAPGKLPIGRL